jgi:hypothetical protein
VFFIDCGDELSFELVRRAEAEGLPTSLYIRMALLLVLGLEVPIRRVVLRVPDADRQRQGAVWEISEQRETEVGGVQQGISARQPGAGS